MKNSAALRQILAEWPEGDGPDLCEWDPLRQMPARLKDNYHGVASVRMVSTRDGLPCHVCVHCSEGINSRRLLRSMHVSPREVTENAAT